MKYSLPLFAAIFYCMAAPAQTGRIMLSGKLNSNDKAPVLHIENADGASITVPVDKLNNFALVTDSLQKGFYTIEQIGTVYLCPGYRLKVQPALGTYHFEGVGATENNALRAAKKQLAAYVPVSDSDELDDAAYLLDVPVFLQKLDSFQQAGERLYNTSADSFYRKYAALDLQFYGKHLLSLYNLYYGIGKRKLDSTMDIIDTADRKSVRHMMTTLTMLNKAHVKILRWQDEEKLQIIITNKWDKNNDTLFRNSFYYRQSITQFLQYMVGSKKYPADYSRPWKPERSDERMLTVAKGEITNAYILSYFEYNLTSSILQQTKDTAVLNRYYNLYLAKPGRPGYLAEIKEIYNNAVAYTDNAQAPAFAYPDVTGKTVTLESLRGKYVYIDVWATWCGPCKAELPHLKEVEADYEHKNITFVSLSVDEQQDKSKWKEFVHKNGLAGIQLMSDHAFASAFVKKMNINAIPRFILIDPAGKLIAANALRPSDKALRTRLDKLLLVYPNQ